METDRKSTLIHPSTWELFKEGRRTAGYGLLNWLHGYVYGRWPYLYIGIGVGEHPLAQVFGRLVSILSWLQPRRDSRQTSRATRVGLAADFPDRDPQEVTFADTYHGKVVPLAAARQLVTVNQEIRLTDLEQVLPYTRARDIVLKNPDHLIALDCPCRSARPNPCLPLDVCLIVGEPFASFVYEHHPRRSRWISPKEAMAILQAEDERGHVHHAFFKEAMLGRFYAICNCCSCCCGAMQAHQHGTPMLASSGYASQVDEHLCIGCDTCADTCQFGAIALVNGLAVIDDGICMGCGVCISKCSEGALALVRDTSKGVPLEIRELVESSTDLV